MRKLKLEELGRVDVEAYADVPKIPVTVILDNIRSALNVGSVFRTADAMAIEEIILCGITAQPPHKEIKKTAIGATKSVKWSYQKKVLEAVKEAQSKGAYIIGVEQIDESVPLTGYSFPTDKPIVIILGNEVNGISDDILPLLDQAIEIKQYGTKHSLNVSVCAGILMWELRQAIG